MKSITKNLKTDDLLNKLELSSELGNVRLLDSFLCKLQKVYGVSPEKLVDIRLSIMEAVNNAMIHGNHLDAEKKVIISEEKEEEYLTLCIQDQGKGFDPAKVKDPTLTENIALPGGRGLYLMRCLTDDMHFQNNGNSVILRFKL